MSDDGALRDAETGLLNAAFFRAALPNRIATARRVLRPISVVLLTLGDREAVPGRCAPEVATAVAEGLRETLRESDTACRMDDGGFAVVLEDTPEDGAVWTVERLRRFLADQDIHVTVWAGVSCYPAHALETPEILARAEAALTMAMEWSQSRIEVAVPE